CPPCIPCRTSCPRNSRASLLLLRRVENLHQLSREFETDAGAIHPVVVVREGRRDVSHALQHLDRREHRRGVVLPDVLLEHHDASLESVGHSRSPGGPYVVPKHGSDCARSSRTSAASQYIWYGEKS